MFSLLPQLALMAAPLTVSPLNYLDYFVQIKGEFKVEDVSNGSEEEDYIYTVTVDGIGTEQVGREAGAHSCSQWVGGDGG